MQIQVPTSNASPRTIQVGDDLAPYKVMNDFVFNLKVNESYNVNVTGTIENAFQALAQLDPVKANSIKNSIDTSAALGSNILSPSKSLLASRATDDDCCGRTAYKCDVYTNANCDRIEYVVPAISTPTLLSPPHTCL